MDTDKNKKSPEIVEGEILDESSDANSNKKTVEDKKNTSKQTSRAPWVISGILIAFIGGLFFEPWFEYGIERLFPGTIPPKQEAQITQDLRPDQNEKTITLIQSQLTILKNEIEAQAQKSENIEAVLSQLNEGISSLRVEFSDLNEKTKNFSPAVISENPDNTETINLFENRLKELEGQISNLQAGIKNSSTEDISIENTETSNQYIDQLGSIEERLQAMESKTYEQGKANPLPISIATLARRVDGGQTFDQELLIVRANFETLSALDRAKAKSSFDTLVPIASSGVLSKEDLRLSFSKLISTSLRANDLEENAGYWQKTKSWFSNLVVIRKTGDVQGEDDEAIIARAEKSLNAKNIEKTIETIEALSSPAKSVMTPWLDDAKTRIKALKAINILIPIVFNEGQS